MSEQSVRFRGKNENCSLFRVARDRMQYCGQMRKEMRKEDRIFN